MRLRLSAVTLAANEQRDNPDIKVNVYKASIEFTIESRAFDLPNQTSIFFSKLKQQENSIIIESIAGTLVGDSSSISTDKKTFDDTFCTEVRKKGYRNVVLVHFVIRSQRSWSTLKFDLFDYLQENKIWLRKTPGPLTTSTMTAIGHITNIPREASISCVTTEIKLKIVHNKQQRKDEMEENDKEERKKLDEYKLEIYLDRQRITSEECTDTEGKQITHKVIDNYAHVVYSKKEDAEMNKFLLENFSSNLPHAAKYIPFGLK